MSSALSQLYCLQAGSQCALYRSGDSETNIVTRFQSVMDNIKANPVPLFTSKTKTPVIINYSEMRNLLFSVSYTPIKSFPPLAVIFNSLLNNNASALELVVTVPDDPTPFSARLPSYKYQPKEEQLGIMCSDKRYPVSSPLPHLTHLTPPALHRPRRHGVLLHPSPLHLLLCRHLGNPNKRVQHLVPDPAPRTLRHLGRQENLFHTHQYRQPPALPLQHLRPCHPSLRGCQNGWTICECRPDRADEWDWAYESKCGESVCVGESASVFAEGDDRAAAEWWSGDAV